MHLIILLNQEKNKQLIDSMLRAVLKVSTEKGLVPVNKSLCLSFMFLFPALHLHFFFFFFESFLQNAFTRIPIPTNNYLPCCSICHFASHHFLSLTLHPPSSLTVLIPSLLGMWLPWQQLNHPLPPTGVP